MKRFPRTGQKKLIQETAAGEEDTREAEVLRRGEDHLSDGLVKGERHFFYCTMGRQQRADELTAIPQKAAVPLFPFPENLRSVRGCHRGGFQRHGALAFEMILLAKSQKRRRRIEETAHGRAFYRIHMMRERSADERRARILRRKVCRGQIRECALPRLFHRGIASDHGNRCKVPHALHGRPLAEKDLSAPDAAVLAIASTVKDESE